MKITKPIDLKDNAEFFSEYLIDEAVQFLNQKISGRVWHDNFTDKEEIREKYHAIHLVPYGHFNDVMDKVIEMFKETGWDCMWKSCYDARGPHHCFYVSKDQIIRHARQK